MRRQALNPTQKFDFSGKSNFFKNQKRTSDSWNQYASE